MVTFGRSSISDALRLGAGGRTSRADCGQGSRGRSCVRRSSSIIGRAYASPTIVIMFTRSRAAASRIVRMSKGAESSWSTTVAPMPAAMNVVHCAATCISGEVGNHVPAPAIARCAERVLVEVLGTAHAGDEQVGLAPEHRLGVARGPTGARDVQSSGDGSGSSRSRPLRFSSALLVARRHPGRLGAAKPSSTSIKHVEVRGDVDELLAEARGRRSRPARRSDGASSAISPGV